MNLKRWNLEQWKQIKEEANSSDNKYYFGLANGRSAQNEDELIIYYILNGGALKWRKEHEDEKPNQDLR
jgi:hypothetical protein